jgi:hypothetical protein
MSHLRRRSRLLPEAAFARWVPCELANHLERHDALQPRVFHFVHHPHAAFADNGEDFTGTNALWKFSHRKTLLCRELAYPTHLPHATAPSFPNLCNASFVDTIPHRAMCVNRRILLNW